MASVGGSFQSGHGPVERAGVVNFVGRARANLAGGTRWGETPWSHHFERSEANGVSIFPTRLRRRSRGTHPDSESG